MNNCSMDLQEHQLQRSTFQWHDYVLFAIMVLISVCLGIYHGYFSKKQSVNDYLTGSRKMKVIPIAFSLTASLVSGVSMVALPADVYNFGATIALIPILVPMALLFCCQYVLPVLYNLKLTSIYEYIELRFDHRMRLISSFLYILYMVPTLPAMLYVPALSLSQGTGFSVHYFTVALSSICIFYTTVGGFKAVISTDTLQFIFMLGTNLGIMFMGVWHSGGLNNIYQSSLETGRLDLDFDLDPTKRDTFWTIGIGFMTYWIQNIVTNQTCMQKSFSLPTVKKMKKAVMLFGLGFFIITLANIGFGLIIFDEFKDCDPISSGKIRRPDEIASFYILSVTKHLPGIAGLYISGVFSGSLSSMSAAINSLSCTIFKDFVSFNLNEKWKKHSPTFIRLIGVIIGLISIALVFLLENLGNVLPTIVSMGGIAAGPMLGLFILGLFTITANAKGAFYGVISGLITVVFIFVGSQYYRVNKFLVYPTKGFSTEGCNCTLSSSQQYQTSMNDFNEWTPPYIFTLSYHYNTLIGTIVTITIGMIMSYVYKKEYHLAHKDHISPLIYCMLPELVNQGDDDGKPINNTIL